MSHLKRNLDAVLWGLLVLSYVAVALSSVVVWNAPASLGVGGNWEAGQGVRLTWVNPYGPIGDAGGKAGDFLLSTDGQPMSAARWASQQDTGTAFVFLDATTGREVSGDGGNEGLVAARSVALLELVGFIFALVGSLVFLRSRRTAPITSFMIFSMVSAMAFGISPASARYATWATVGQGMLIQWFLFTFYLFFALFPRMRLQPRSWITAGSIALGAATLALNVALVVAVFWVSSLFAPTRTIGFAHLSIGIVAGVALAVTSYRQAASPVEREQLRIMVVGTILAVLPFVLLSILPALIFAKQVLRPDIGALGIILLPLSFAYSIKRHQLFGIRRLVHRGVAYFLISVAVVTVFAGTVASLSALGETDLASNTVVQVVLLAFLFAGATFLSTTRKLVFQTIDRVLYKDYVDYPQLMRDVSVSAAAASSLDQLKQRVLTPIRTELLVKFAAFATLQPDNDPSWMMVGSAPPRAELTSLVEVPPGPVTLQQIIRQHYSPVDGANLLSVVVAGEGGRAFAMVIGPKQTQEPFGEDDMRAIEAIAGQLATIVDKLELVNELQAKSKELQELNRMLVEANEAERARIAAHLHDDPLQKITYVLWLCQDQHVPPEVVKHLQDVVSDLRNFTVLLRPVELQDLGLARALEALVDDVEGRATFTADLRMLGLARDDRLPDDIELGVYRIVQEALNNCQKHAKASNVWVRVQCNGPAIQVLVEDDGAGFSARSDKRPRMGIPGMRQRAEQLGGHFNVSPRKPHGTSVKATIPIPTPEIGASGPLEVGANHD